MIDVRGSEAIVEDDQANRRATYACGCCTQGSPDRFSARICVNLPRIRPVVCFIGCDPLPRFLGYLLSTHYSTSKTGRGCSGVPVPRYPRDLGVSTILGYSLYILGHLSIRRNPVGMPCPTEVALYHPSHPCHSSHPCHPCHPGRFCGPALFALLPTSQPAQPKARLLLPVALPCLALTLLPWLYRCLPGDRPEHAQAADDSYISLRLPPGLTSCSPSGWISSTISTFFNGLPLAVALSRFLLLHTQYTTQQPQGPNVTNSTKGYIKVYGCNHLHAASTTPRRHRQQRVEGKPRYQGGHNPWTCFRPAS